MIEANKVTQIAPEQPVNSASFEGYTLDELNYRRAIVSLKKDFYKERLLQNLHSLQHASPLNAFTGTGGNQNKRKFRTSSIFSKMMKSLSVIDYALMGVSVFKSVSSVIKVFKRKK